MEWLGKICTARLGSQNLKFWLHHQTLICTFWTLKWDLEIPAQGCSRMGFVLAPVWVCTCRFSRVCTRVSHTCSHLPACIPRRFYISVHSQTCFGLPGCACISISSSTCVSRCTFAHISPLFPVLLHICSAHADICIYANTPGHVNLHSKTQNILFCPLWSRAVSTECLHSWPSPHRALLIYTPSITFLPLSLTHRLWEV